jgi:excisionase family DNA binding protein
MNPTENVPLSYGIKDAARALGISSSTVWRLVASGDLSVFRILGRTLITHKELERFIDERARQGEHKDGPLEG